MKRKSQIKWQYQKFKRRQNNCYISDLVQAFANVEWSVIESAGQHAYIFQNIL